MLSYNLTEIKLADLKNLFFIKNNFFSKFIANKSFRQFVLQLLGKLIATVFNETKS